MDDERVERVAWVLANFDGLTHPEPLPVHYRARAVEVLAALDAAGQAVALPAAEAVKRQLRMIRRECVSGMPEMGACDEAWQALFGDSPDAPWLAVYR